MRVIYFDLTDKLRHGNTEPVATLQELLAQSDFVTLHVPETPETHGMIGEAELRAMKRGAFLINDSRGTVVDLDALAEALRDGHLARRRRRRLPGGAGVQRGPLRRVRCRVWTTSS